MAKSLLALCFWTLLLLDSRHSLVNGLVCPDALTIFPCTCLITIFGTELYCVGSSVTQEVVSQTIAESRISNNVTGLDKLDIQYFRLGATNLATVDLTPFFLLRLNTLDFLDNPFLSSIVGPDLELNNGSFQLSRLLFQQCGSLTDSGFGVTLKYTAPSTLRTLSMLDTRITGGHYIYTDDSGNPSVEFLPGLSELTNLSELYIAGNEIRVVGGGQFKRNAHLTDISLHSNHYLKIGEDAFLIDESEDFRNQSLEIQLGHNDFITSDFNCLNLISPIGRPVRLIIHDFENVEYLAVQFFHPFLMAHPTNTIDFYFGASFQCDSRMNWLKDQRELFENRVQQCWCSNYPGETCFSFP